MADFANALVDGGGTMLTLMKRSLGQDVSDPSDDAALSRSLDFAGQMTETYLDRVIVKRAREEWFEAHFDTVELRDPQVDNSIAPTVTAGGVVQTGYEITLTRGKRAFLSRTGHPHDVPMDWRQLAQVTVTYTAGYDPIPSDLATSIVLTAVGLFHAEGTGTAPGGSSGEVKSMSIYDVGSLSFDTGSGGSDDGTWSSPGAISTVAAEMITRYKRMSA